MTHSITDKMIQAIADNLTHRQKGAAITKTRTGYIQVQFDSDVIVTLSKTKADKIQVAFDMPGVTNYRGNDWRLVRAIDVVNQAIDDAPREVFDISFRTQ